MLRRRKAVAGSSAERGDRLRHARRLLDAVGDLVERDEPRPERDADDRLVHLAVERPHDAHGEVLAAERHEGAKTRRGEMCLRRTRTSGTARRAVTAATTSTSQRAGEQRRRRGPPRRDRVTSTTTNRTACSARAHELDRLEGDVALGALERREERARRHLEVQLRADERKAGGRRRAGRPRRSRRRARADRTAPRAPAPRRRATRPKNAIPVEATSLARLEIAVGARLGDVARDRDLDADVGQRRVAAQEGQAQGERPDPRSPRCRDR